MENELSTQTGRRLKIAYVASYNAKDVNNWSGTGAAMARLLEKHIGDIEYIDSLSVRENIFDILTKKTIKLFTNKRYATDRTEKASRQFAQTVDEKIAGKEFDLIFSPGTIPVAWLKTKIPIVFWTDATFSSMVGYYFNDLSKGAIRNGNKVEKQALENCRLAIYCSPWAANSAINDYGVDPNKVHIVPFGANIENGATAEFSIKKAAGPVNLLFVGKEWERKGGSIAVDTLFELEKAGIPATLTIVGCRPPKQPHTKNIQVYEFLDKNIKEEFDILNKLYRAADFFLLPTRSECFAIVLSEALSFGLPALTTNTGGLSSIVDDGINGFLFPLAATGKDYADKIEAVIGNPEHYSSLRIGARKKFEEVLNWDSSGKALKRLLESEGML